VRDEGVESVRWQQLKGAIERRAEAERAGNVPTGNNLFVSTGEAHAVEGEQAGGIALILPCQRDIRACCESSTVTAYAEARPAFA